MLDLFSLEADGLTFAYGTYRNCLTSGYVSFRFPVKVPVLVLTVKLSVVEFPQPAVACACAEAASSKEKPIAVNILS